MAVLKPPEAVRPTLAAMGEPTSQTRNNRTGARKEKSAVPTQRQLGQVPRRCPLRIDESVRNMTTTQERTRARKATPPPPPPPQEETQEAKKPTFGDRVRVRVRAGWTRAKKFAGSAKNKVKSAGRKTKSGTTTAVKKTGTGIKVASRWVYEGVIATLFGIGYAVRFIVMVIGQTIAWIMIAAALVVAAVLVLIAIALAFVVWLAIKVIWFVCLALMTPWYAYQDRRARKDENRVETHNASAAWRIWVAGMRPRNWHVTNLQALRAHAVAEPTGQAQARKEGREDAGTAANVGGFAGATA